MPHKSKQRLFCAYALAFAVVSGCGTSFTNSNGRLHGFLRSGAWDSLANADEVIIDSKSDGVMYPLTTLGGGGSGTTLEMLRRLKPVPFTSPSQPANITIGVMRSSGRDNLGLPTLSYSTKTGEIWAEGKHTFVPYQFQVWLQNIYAKAPKRHFKVTRYNRVNVTTEVVSSTPRRPTATIVVRRGRYHAYYLHDERPLSKPSFDGMYDIEYMVGSNSTKTTGWKGLPVAYYRPAEHTWPTTYAGKTITYRFRWKNIDGTTGPWSKPVSAKVLP